MTGGKIMYGIYNYNPYDGGRLPPCTDFLGNLNPIIKDGKLIFRNLNRVYYFISTTSANAQTRYVSELPETTTPLSDRPFTSSNFQVSLSTFIIGLYIDQIQQKIINYDENIPIHPDKSANNFVHQLLRNPPQVNVDYIPELSLLVSHPNAVLPLYTYATNITPLNFYILFILNRLENNPGLFFSNNSFATEDPINFTLASLNIQFPII
jgi:hypothetical protein